MPILLTSPWPESIYAFCGLMPLIEDLGPLIAVDLPGFGQSEGRANVLTPTGMANFVIELARTLGIPRMHAIGPDVGTPALLLAAASRPDLFESLVIGSGAASVELAGDSLQQIIRAPAGAFANVDGGDLAVNFVVQSLASPASAAVIEDYRQSSAGRRFADAAGFVQAYPRDLPRLHALLPSIQTPVLILAGRSDPIVPPTNGDSLAKSLPHCSNELLEGGHLIWEDACALYGKRVHEWISGDYRRV